MSNHLSSFVFQIDPGVSARRFPAIIFNFVIISSELEMDKFIAEIVEMKLYLIYGDRRRIINTLLRETRDTEKDLEELS